jgi:hypothetical protein
VLHLKNVQPLRESVEYSCNVTRRSNVNWPDVQRRNSVKKTAAFDVYLQSRLVLCESLWITKPPIESSWLTYCLKMLFCVDRYCPSWDPETIFQEAIRAGRQGNGVIAIATIPSIYVSVQQYDCLSNRLRHGKPSWWILFSNK